MTKILGISDQPWEFCMRRYAVVSFVLLPFPLRYVPGSLDVGHEQKMVRRPDGAGINREAASLPLRGQR